MQPFDTSRLVWTRRPAAARLAPDCIEITTAPRTDLWQRTYYHFRNDSAPVLQMTTEEQYFSFLVREPLGSSSPKMAHMLTPPLPPPPGR